MYLHAGLVRDHGHGDGPVVGHRSGRVLSRVRRADTDEQRQAAQRLRHQRGGQPPSTRLQSAVLTVHHGTFYQVLARCSDRFSHTGRHKDFLGVPRTCPNDRIFGNQDTSTRMVLQNLPFPLKIHKKSFLAHCAKVF